MSNDHKATAIEWAEVSEDPKTLAITHALLYLGEQLADQTVELSAIIDSLPPPRLEDDKREVVRSKLAATLSAPSPFQDEAESEPESVVNGHVPAKAETITVKRFPARHDPADWTKLPDGRWESPTGRKYAAYSRQAIGVARARLARGLPV